MSRKKKSEPEKTNEVKTKAEQEKSNTKKTKPKPNPNEPIYDVAVTEDGDVDVISEEVIEQAEFPPEVYDAVYEQLMDLHKRLDLKPGEPFPTDAIDELARGFVDSGLFEQILTDSYTGASDDSETDENELMSLAENIDFSQIEPNEFGVRILTGIEIAPPEEYEGYVTFNMPVVFDEDARNLNVAIEVHMPYLKKLSVNEIDEAAGNYFIYGDQALLIDNDTYKSYNEISDCCGLTNNMKRVEAGSSAVEEIQKYQKENLSKNAEPKHEDGYDEETKTYWLDNRSYGEKDVIWLEISATRNAIGNMKGFSANFDSYRDIYYPCDITNIRGREFADGKRVLSKMEKFEIQTRGQKEDFFSKLLPGEEIFYLAREYAKQKDDVGFAVVCRDGKFYLPVESFFDPNTGDFDHLIIIFNAIATSVNHHACACLMVADIGNMSFQTAIRYAKGKIYDWHNRVEQEIKAYKKWNSDFNPYDDPYDNIDGAHYD